jgi:ATP-dependent Clp protease ATP-binding subunit ClpB
VGYEEGGQLTEAVRRHPYSVILFDEFEKAHRDVSNVLLQILDDGRVTDSQGRTVDFKNTVIIMTSNIGSHHLLSGVNEHGEINEMTRVRVMEELEAHCRPEFLNRVDEIVLFTPLALSDIERIVDIQVGLLRERLRERHIELELTEPARVWLAKTGYDPVYGARPLKRVIQRTLETRIGRALIAGEIPDGSSLRVELEDDQLVVRPGEQSPVAAAAA